MASANEIREYARAKYIETARRRGQRTVTFSALDIHKGLGYKDRYPIVCSSIDADKFLDFANVIMVRREGVKASSAVTWTFEVL